MRFFSVRPRLPLSIALGMLVTIALPHSLISHGITRFIIGWDTFACVYLALAMHIVLRSSHESMKQRAHAEDEGKFVILFLVVAAAITSLIAIIVELSVVKDIADNFIKYEHILLALFTIAMSWVFMHTMFALHYAHDYYTRISREKSGGLDFPGKEILDYSDFLYLSFIIGTSGQTADVSFSSRATRRIGTIHCIIAFFFNTTILALTINIASGLF